MVRQMLEALILKHGEEVVTGVLNQARNHLVEGEELKTVEVQKAEEIIADYKREHPTMTPSIHEAWRLTHGNRKSSYGDVSVSFARYAKIWSGLLGNKLKEDLTASDVTLLMTALKLAREMNKQQSDNVTDAHGYLILHDEIKAFEAEQAASDDEHA